MATYIVTGHLGFIGKRLSNTLTESGNTVIGFEIEDALSPEWTNNLNIIFDENPIDGVFHVGACSDTLERDVNKMMFLNFEVSKHLYNLCKTHGVKMVYSSSAANYGTDGTLPANLYAWSKYTAEKYIEDFGVCLRYFNVFGPGEENKGRMASVGFQAYKKYFISCEIEEMLLFPGNPKRDFIYIDDVVNANVHAMEISESGTYDIGTTTPIGFEIFMEEFGIPYRYTDPDQIPEGYQFFTKANREKILPGWSPKFGIKDRIGHYKLYLQSQEYESVKNNIE